MTKKKMESDRTWNLEKPTREARRLKPKMVNT
jgi:hypothetical protein